ASPRSATTAGPSTARMSSAPSSGDARGMKNFLRAFRFAWAYRGRLFISVACALFAAVFWGLNFTAIYPVLKILGSDKNLQEWIDWDIDQSQKNIDGWHADLERLLKQQQKYEQMDLTEHRSHM